MKAQAHANYLGAAYMPQQMGDEGAREDGRVVEPIVVEGPKSLHLDLAARQLLPFQERDRPRNCSMHAPIKLLCAWRRIRNGLSLIGGARRYAVIRPCGAGHVAAIFTNHVHRAFHVFL